MVIKIFTIGEDCVGGNGGGFGSIGCFKVAEENVGAGVGGTYTGVGDENVCLGACCCIGGMTEKGGGVIEGAGVTGGVIVGGGVVGGTTGFMSESTEVIGAIVGVTGKTLGAAATPGDATTGGTTFGGTITGGTVVGAL